MSGECNKCNEHCLDCECQQISNDIDVYITMESYHKLNQYIKFIPSYLYSTIEPKAYKELGKFEIHGGLTLRFHLKRCEIPIEIHEELLRQAKLKGD